MNRFVSVVPLAVSLLSLVGCGEGARTDVENVPYHSNDPKWVYAGTLPALENIVAVASLKGHTLRVSGLLPAGFSRPLPFYVTSVPEGNRTRIHVVYPIATANTAGGSSNAPGHYGSVSILPYTPFGNDVEWGGFPYIEYNYRRSIAFHGPITHGSSEWFLKRGKVSHGCNRMQGEHVVEYAHLLGADMTRTHSASASRSATLSLDVISDYDTFQGANVDVDYPVQSGVTRPSGNVKMFPTWDARDYPRFVCEYKSGRALGPTHCDYKPAPIRDPYGGLDPLPLGEIACPQGYSLESVGSSGGKMCTDGTNVWGPFTEKMISKCLSWGGGEEACRSLRWSRTMVLSARGTGVCPDGASYDSLTTYCVEGQNAFGPFPAELVARCQARGGGEACHSARWSRSFLASIMGR